MADKRSIWDLDEHETLAALVEQVGACTEAVNTYGSLVGKLAEQQKQVVEALNKVLTEITRTADADDGALQKLLTELATGVKTTVENTGAILQVVQERLPAGR